ncbi:MAG TPA: hypothetical protein VLA96_12825 [Terriglobales bacterium]|nr:hypothetical protein [Terriglobales bacterium]
MNDGLYYKHSGKYSLGGAIYALVVGSVILCVGAFVYAYLILYLPFVYINALITAGYGIVLGFTCATLLKKKKVRSDGVAVGLTFVLTSVAYYFGWATWVWALARRTDTSIAPFSLLVGLVLWPPALWEIIKSINVEGAWTLRGSAVTGWALWAVWAIEFAMIFGFSLWTAYKTMDEEPFCETCEEWAKKKEQVVEAAIRDLNEYKRRLEGKDFKFLEAAGAPKAETMEFQRIDVFSCEKCGVFHTLDSTTVKVKIESGKRKEETAQSMHHLVLTASEAQALVKLGQAMNPPVLAEAEKAAGANA